jgi:Domain of unknown function (DUF5602)
VKKLIFACFTAILMLNSCSKTATTDPNPIYKGALQAIGDGKAHSWVQFTGDKPTSIGITLTKGALDNLPHGTPVSLSFTLPAEAVGKTPFDHIYLDFSHAGHEPVGTYDVAHFDLHFAMQTVAERSAIPPYSPATAAKFDNLPPDGIMPKPYIRLPAGVPAMGVHWANPTTPEMNGGKFTETLILGSYDGKMTFVEPMISLTLLQGKPSITKAIPMPTKFAKAGLFPMKYSIKQVGDEVQISLDDMMLMQ